MTRLFENCLVCAACMTAIAFFASEHDKEYLQMNLIISLTKALMRMKLSQYSYLLMFLYYTLQYMHIQAWFLRLRNQPNTTSNEQNQGVLSTGV